MAFITPEERLTYNRLWAQLVLDNGYPDWAFITPFGDLLYEITSTEGTVTSITAGSGLLGGTITTTGTISMPNVGPGSGTYGGGSTFIESLTLDDQGRLVAVTSATPFGDIGGTIDVSQVAFGGALNTIAGSNNLTWDGSSLDVIGNVSLTPTHDIRFNGEGDANWRIGINLGSFVHSVVGNSTSLDVVVGAGAPGPDGFSVGITGANSMLEANGNTGKLWFRNPFTDAGQFNSIDTSGRLLLNGATTTLDWAALSLAGGNWSSTGNFNATGTIGGSNFSGSSSGTNTGDQTITLTGDVTGSGTGSFATTIANQAVTYAKFQNLSTNNTILGRYSAGAGSVQEIVIGSGLSLSGNTLISTGTGGTVTSVSVISANGLAGTVATATTTPAITLSTTVTGLLKGNGTAISAAISGTDYQPAGNYITALTGDVTATGPGSATATLANTAVTAGSYGDAADVAIFTVDSKGRLTLAANTAIQITESQVTNLTSDLAGKLTNTLPSADIFVGNGSNVATAVTLSGDATLANTGALTVSNGAITSTKLAAGAAAANVGTLGGDLFGSTLPNPIVHIYRAINVLVEFPFITGTVSPVSISDSVMSGFVPGGSISGMGTIGVVAASFSSLANETGTGSGQGGLGSTASLIQPYNSTDFPGIHGISAQVRTAAGNAISLGEVLSTALPPDNGQPIFAVLSYRSDLGVNLKWRAWYYYRRISDGAFMSFTPDTSIANAQLFIPNVFLLDNVPVGYALGAVPTTAGQAGVQFGSNADIQSVYDGPNFAGSTGRVADAGHQHDHGDLTDPNDHALVTESAHGFMSSSDKTKLDAITGTNTGDVTLAGQNYLSILGQVITANPVNLSNSNITGILASTSFPALIGDVTTTAGSLTTTIANQAVTYAKIQNVSTNDTLLGRYSVGAGSVQEITIGSGLSLSGSTLTSTGTGGTVTSVSVVSANGLAGTVATATTTPAITLSTTVTGLLKGDGTAISAAVSGTDYQPAGNYITALTGDVTATGPGSATATLANTAVTAGSYGDAADVATFTVDSKGRLTAASNVSIQITESQVTNLTSDLAGKLTNILPSADIFVGNGSNVATAVALSGDATLANTGALTLANTTVVAATYGDASHVSQVTFDTKGRAISASNVSIAIDASAITTGTLPEIRGGTNQSTYTLGDTLYASATNTLSKLAGNTTPTRNFLRQTGTGVVSAAPAWDTILASDIPGAALTEVNDTNVTLTLGGSPSTALLNATSLTLGWTGQLSIARGGTNSGTALNNHRIMQSSGGSIVEAAAITANQALISDANGIPTQSVTTATELGYVSGVTSAIQTQLNGKLTSALPSADIFVGNGSNVATAVTLSGDATLANTGALTVNNQAITYAKIQNVSTNNTLLGRYTAGAGSVQEITVGTGLTLSGGGTLTSTGSGGTVTSVSVVSANGLAGTVATPTTTPAITLSTTVTGLLKGNGTAISAAVADTDYQNPISLAAVGASPNADGATFTSDTLTLQPADGTHPGLLTSGTQTIGGAKTFSSDVTANSVRLSGTAGAGFTEYLTQSSNPAAPASGYREFADSSGRFAWIETSDGFVRSIDGVLTASRVYTLPNATGNFQLNTAIVTKSANYTITVQDFFAGQVFLVDTSGGAFSLTLPSPSTLNGYSIRFKDSTGSFSTNNLTLARNGSEKIDNFAASKVFQTNYGGWQIFSDGTNWWVF